MENNCKIVMLPTQDKSILYISDNILQRSSTPLSSLSINRNLKNQHLYIVNDEKIQEGDWSYHTNQKSIIQIGSEAELMKEHLYLKKVIATTDIFLTYAKRIRADVRVSKSLPQPSQQFIEKYIESYNKGVILSDVLAECESIKIKVGQYAYLDDVQLKINSDNTINIKSAKIIMYTKKDLKRAFEAGNRLPISSNETIIKDNFEQWINKQKENL